MPERDPYEGASRYLFVIPCVELEDSTFKSVREALDECAREDCGDNEKHGGKPDIFCYVLNGIVRRTGEDSMKHPVAPFTCLNDGDAFVVEGPGFFQRVSMKAEAEMIRAGLNQAFVKGQESTNSDSDESKALWEILVPTERIVKEWPSEPGQLGGKVIESVPVEYHREWDAKVREIAGGLTILRSGKGEWVSPQGTTFRERMIPVRVCCTEAEIKRIARITAEHYDQEAVMFYKLSDEVVIYRFDGVE